MNTQRENRKMANLKVVIKVREKGGTRRWLNATEKSGGSFYIQFCEGSKAKPVFIGTNYDEAVAAKIRKERELFAASKNLLVPETPTPETKKYHRIDAVILAYLADLKLSGFPEKTIKAKKFELGEFVKSCGKMYVEQINRVDLLTYKNNLKDAGKQDVTIYNKLMNVSTWLKKNTVVPITGLLRSTDWPKKLDTKPQPYSQKEQEAMMAVCAPKEKLLLRFMLNTGCREQEIAHAEIEDIKDNYIEVKAKPKYGWSPKTDAGTRSIPLGDTLVADLKNHCSSGLLFPNGQGRPEGHFLQIIKAIAKRAGVADACNHRFRDTFATEQVRSRELDLRDVARLLGHANLSTIKLYASYVDLQSDQARRAANAADKFAEPGPQLAQKAG
jgi:integrase